MLNAGQLAHFRSFGYLHVPEFFTTDEIRKIAHAADTLWLSLRDDDFDSSQGQAVDQFVERDETLTELLITDRLISSVQRILGPGFLWVGSEGNVTVNTEHPWHPDRPGDHDEVSYTRLKINLYLDAVSEENGCLRVISSSHRMPLHGEIEPNDRHQRQGLPVRPYGVSGLDIPHVPLESEPGDAVLFHQSLWHAVFNGYAGRRYIALKFAARPTNDYQISSLRHYTGGIFEPHPAWRESRDERIRSMINDLPRLGAKRVPRFIPFRDD